MAQQRENFEIAVAAQRKDMEALVAWLNEQEAGIQKISARIETRMSEAEMLVGNQ
jgi:hypothetical protein